MTSYELGPNSSEEPLNASSQINDIAKLGDSENKFVRCNLARDSLVECLPLSGDKSGNVVDIFGRKLTLKGINVDGAMKLPKVPDLRSRDGSADEENSIFWDGEHVSFVGRPFPLEEAETHFRRIKSWGYNTIRYLITWEALEHEGPGIYDEDFIDYTIKMLSIINGVGGLYVFLEVHQDVWSRFCGGSGAPLWTLYVVGLQPKRFYLGSAAVFHNEKRFRSEADANKWKMMWTSNYYRLAAMTMFTAFFAGKTFFPKCTINRQNIQDYLQGSYTAVIRHFWKRICDGVPQMIDNGSLLGFESMNEPNPGLVGWANVGIIPDSQQLRVGTTPTVFQSLKLGMGFACAVDEYQISIMGPKKSRTTIVDPKGVSTWLTVKEAKDIDQKYGWKRNADWVIGECIYKLHGIWDWDESFDVERYKKTKSGSIRAEIAAECCVLNLPDYFNTYQPIHGSRIVEKYDMEYFINSCFVDFYVQFKNTIREINQVCFVLMQPPVLEPPPKLLNDGRGIVDSKTIYCPHYYDGLSLMFKSWNTVYNVDTFGIMRGKYFKPFLSLVVGEKAIRNCFKSQFLEMKKECYKNLGHIPILMSETGMPFDMDNKQAYINGKYTSQTSALDALAYALEGANFGHTYWCYTSINTHAHGDGWNNEDFSFWSLDDHCGNSEIEISTLDNLHVSADSVSASLDGKKDFKMTSSLKKEAIENCISRSNALNLDSDFTPDAVDLMDSKKIGRNQSVSSEDSLKTQGSNINRAFLKAHKRLRKHKHALPDGVRAYSAVIRPYLVATLGNLLSAQFDLKQVKFSLKIRFNAPKESSSYELPTIVFVPKLQFVCLTEKKIKVSSGSLKYDESLECLEWYHDFGSKTCFPRDESIVIRRDLNYGNGNTEGIAESDDQKCIIV